MIFDIGFIGLVLFAVCMVVYYKQLYENPFYLFIAATICDGLLVTLYKTIRDVIDMD